MAGVKSAVAAISLWFGSALPALTQQWAAETPADISYAGGWAFAPGGLSVSCAASRDGRGQTALDSLWFEASIASPWHFMLVVSEALVPDGPMQRSDMILYLDQTGYQLPPVALNELSGGWEVALSMTDPVFDALRNASRIVLQVGAQTAWEIPAANVGPAINQVAQTCAATWRRTGHPPPNALTGPGDVGARQDVGMRHWAEEYAATACSDFITPGPNAFVEANLDGDGIPDIIVDHNEITCDALNLRSSFCGASLCTVDVYLSSRFPQTSHPEGLLAISVSVIELSNGNHALATTGNLSTCQNNPDCTFIWYWDGTQLTQLPR